MIGVQVSPLNGRVHYCPTLNLFVVYRRRAAKWYPILWYPYDVHREAREQPSSEGRGKEKALCEHDTCCYITSPIVINATLALRCESGRFRLVRDEHARDMGSSNRVPLDTTQLGSPLNRVWSLPAKPLSRVATCKRIYFSVSCRTMNTYFRYSITSQNEPTKIYVVFCMSHIK